MKPFTRTALVIAAIIAALLTIAIIRARHVEGRFISADDEATIEFESGRKVIATLGGQKDSCTYEIHFFTLTLICDSAAIELNVHLDGSLTGPARDFGEDGPVWRKIR